MLTVDQNIDLTKERLAVGENWGDKKDCRNYRNLEVNIGWGKYNLTNI